MADQPWLFVPPLVVTFGAIFTYAGIGGFTCGLILVFPKWQVGRDLFGDAVLCGILWPFALPAATVMLTCSAAAWLFAPRPKPASSLPKSLPDDVADAYESMRYAIIQHAADGWRMISPEEVCDTLLVLAEFVEEQQL